MKRTRSSITGTSMAVLLVAASIAGAEEPVCPVEPRPTCRVSTRPQRDLFRLVSREGAPVERMLWKWSHGEATDSAEFGNMEDSGNTIALCMYMGTTPQLIGGLIIPGGCDESAGYCWRRNDRQTQKLLAAGDGISISMSLKPGETGRSEIRASVTCEGTCAKEIPAADAMIVQAARVGTTSCWESSFYMRHVEKNGTVRHENAR